MFEVQLLCGPLPGGANVLEITLHSLDGFGLGPGSKIEGTLRHEVCKKGGMPVVHLSQIIR